MRPFRTTPLLCALLASLRRSASRRWPRRRAAVAARRAAGRRARRSIPDAPRRSATGSRRSLAGLAEGERAADRRLLRRARLHAVLDRARQPAGVGADRRARGRRRPGAAGRPLRCRGPAARRRRKPDRRGEVALTRAYLAYAGDLSSGVIDPSAVDDEITRKPARPSAAVLLAPLATAAGRRGAGRASSRPIPTTAGSSPRSAGWRRRRGPRAGGRRCRRARRCIPRTADPASPSCAPGWPASATSRRAARRSTRASTRRSRRRSRRSRATTASSTTGSSARRRSRRSTRRSRRGWRRSRSTSSGIRWMPRDLGAALPLRQHPRLHREARRGRRAGLGVEGRRRQGAGSPRPPSSPTR